MDTAAHLARIAAVAATQRQQAVMDESVRSLAEAFAAPQVLLLRRRGDHLALRAAIGAPDQARHRPAPAADLADPPPGPADARAVAEVLGALGMEPAGHGVVAGLTVEDQPYGLLLLVRPQPWSDGDRAELDRFAQVIALGLLKVRLVWRLWRQEQVLAHAEAGRGADDSVRFADPARTRSPEMRNCLLLARQVAQSDSPVLLGGGTGAGKEVLARYIHRWSPRADRPFIAVNCAALPAGLLESELFGHVTGAFTGAAAARGGRFQAADGGTLLLDEVAELPPAAQAALLRVLQERTFEPVGSDRSVRVDVRLLAATNRDLEAEVDAGRFRRDLWYRLSVFPLHVPALRQRREDIPLITADWLAGHAARTGRGPWSLSPAALGRLMVYDWPGNVRELINCLERATILQPAGALPAEYFPLRRGTAHGPVRGRRGSSAAGDGADIRTALHRCRGRIYGPLGAAALLGLPPSTLQSRMRRLGIARTDGALDADG